LAQRNLPGFAADVLEALVVDHRGPQVDARDEHCKGRAVCLCGPHSLPHSESPR
jgi:hypothetical protein